MRSEGACEETLSELLELATQQIKEKLLTEALPAAARKLLPEQEINELFSGASGLIEEESRSVLKEFLENAVRVYESGEPGHPSKIHPLGASEVPSQSLPPFL